MVILMVALYLYRAQLYYYRYLYFLIILSEKDVSVINTVSFHTLQNYITIVIFEIVKQEIYFLFESLFSVKQKSIIDD